MFGIRPPFNISSHYSPEILDLLNDTVLGSNGARYRHRGIESRIKKLENPLYLNISRNDKVLGNVTFCRRQNDWYVRYFAFDKTFQSALSAKKKSTSNKGIKGELNKFFKNALNDQDGPFRFYAYIDPKNVRSLMMSEQFNFKAQSTIVTQTFSRLKPKNSRDFKLISDKKKVLELLEKNFKSRSFFHPYQTLNSTDFCAIQKENEIVAFAKTHTAEWEIEQLPGKGGKTLTKLIPYVPIIGSMIKPKSHKFTVIDSVWVKEENKNYFEELCGAILFKNQHKVIHWWVDNKDPLWVKLSDKVNWGLLHKVNGIHEVQLVVRSNEPVDKNKVAFVSGFDFI
tara:strand:- start:48110 stop:49129 length:1020 start_codon:yes stop_codon:yes gene_type:complete